MEINDRGTLLTGEYLPSWRDVYCNNTQSLTADDGT